MGFLRRRKVNKNWGRLKKERRAYEAQIAGLEELGKHEELTEQQKIYRDRAKNQLKDIDKKISESPLGKEIKRYETQLEGWKAVQEHGELTEQQKIKLIQTKSMLNDLKEKLLREIKEAK